MSRSIRFYLAVLAASLLLFGLGSNAPIHAQSPSLLTDLNAGSASSQPAGFVEITDPNGDNVAVFAADSGSGRELHRTDGTAGGTSMIRDLNLGLEGSNPLDLVVMNDIVYFRCRKDDVVLNSGEELCRSDGTRDGTFVLKDVRSGSSDSNLRGLTVVDNQLFFFADDGTAGLELWVSDGTETGTQLVDDIYPGSTPLNRASGGFNISLDGRFAGTSDTFFFMANDGTTGLELWASDGTAAGTRLVQDIEPGNGGPSWLRQFTALGDVLVFESFTADTGRELWVSDGTEAGTQSLDLFAGSTGSSPQAITRAGSNVFFFAEYAQSTISQTGLFRYNPTDGAVRVQGGLRPGNGPVPIAAFGDRALIRMLDQSQSRDNLWITDGTQGGTFELSSTIRPDFEEVTVTGSGFEGDVTPAVLNGFAYFQGSVESGEGLELYRTDGTVARTELVQDLNPGTADARLTDFFTYDGRTLLFGASDGIDGIELWSLESLPSSVTVAAPLPDLSVAATRSDVVDLSTTFAESEGQDLTFSAGSSNASIATVSTSNDLDELLIQGVAEGTATIDVIATSSNGDEAVDTFVVTVGPAPPSFEMETRIAFADDFCPDVTDPSTCSVVGDSRFGSPRSDTLANVNPGEQVLVRYILRNFGPGDLTDLDIVDEDRGPIVSGGGPVPRFDSLVVNRIYDAPPATGLDVSQVEGTATSGQGTRGTRRDIYGIDRPAPEVRLETRIAFADDFCPDVTDPSTCSVVGDSRFGSPRSDTLANVNPGEQVLVRYIATNRGRTDLTQFTITDEDRGTVWNGPALDRNGNPERTEPFDSLVVNRIYDAPLPTGVGISRVDVTAEDAGGNADTDATLYGIDRPQPVVRMNVRVARAANFCSDVTDPSTCGVVGDSRFGSPRSDTLEISPLEKVLVRYVVTNFGPTDLAQFTITDEDRGTIFDGAELVTPFDSVVVNRIYDAPTTPGLDLSRVEGAAQDGGGAEDTDRDLYGLNVIGPDIRVDTRIAFADDFCSDVTDPSTCSVVGDSRFGSPRSDTLANVNPGEQVLVRYIASNRGSNTITEVDLTDSERGSILTNESVNIAPFDSVVVNRIYDAPPATGLILSRVDGFGQDAVGNETTTETIYGIDRPAPEVRLETRIARASRFCSDTSDPSTCSVVGDSRFGSPRSDTLENVSPGEQVLVRYIATNRGRTDLTQFTITDEDRGTVWNGPALDRNGNPERTEPFDSLVVNRIYDAPLPTGVDISRVDVTAEDAGGNADTDATLYGIDRPQPVVRMNVRVARAANFCSDVTDPSTCGVVGDSRFGSPRSDTLANVNPGEQVLVRYIATNFGRTDLAQFTITDEDRGTIFDGAELVTPFDSVVVNRIYDAPTLAGVTTSFGRVEASDAGGNAATPKQKTYGVQGVGPAFRFVTLVAPASLFCSNPQDVSTCSTQRLKRSLTTLKSDPDALQKMQRKLGSEREVVRYAFYNTGTLSFVRHTLDDDVAGTVFQDNAFTVAPLDSSIVYRIYSEVPGIGESRTATWRAVTSDGRVLSGSSVEAPLPVELAAFGAQVADRRVTLEWKTASEENNAGFEVQQFDPEQDTWQVLSFVEGAGTSLETQAYRYDVGTLDPDVHRFRLRQVDVSGRFAYSDAIEAVVGIDGPFRFVSPAPHPIRSAATADLTVREAQPVRVELFDLLGRRVSTVFDARMTANRPETIDIQTDGLASGMYFLRVQGETFRHVERVSIVR